MTECRIALALIVMASSVFACGGRTKAGPIDASASDAGESDGSPSELGVSDGGSNDETGTDATPSDDAFAGEGGTDGVSHVPAMDDGAVASCVSRVPLRTQTIEKLDLLFMIDNSASMGDKQALLAQAVPDMITRLVTPNCVDNLGRVLGPADANGACPTGKPEFLPVHDMHIGIVTSSLGGRGSNQCPVDAKNEANRALSAHNDDRGELINRSGDTEAQVPSALPSNFLAWFPPVAANFGGSTPVPPETTIGSPGQAGTLIGDFTAMVQGVHEHGCGFEAQNEAWYRFLVQPDPFDQIVITNNRASLVGIDTTILQQRKAFLRPDSLLAVIVVTDENEEVANPMSVGGEGWLFESAPFPSSPSAGAPEGTIECRAPAGPTNGPNDPNCTSCAFQAVQSSSNFATRCPSDPPNGTQGFLDPTNDSVNVRFFNQKQRFGVFAGYPISRYIRGLTNVSVPDRAHEVDGNGDYVGDQDKYANCVNPIFAQNLPTDPNADLCHLMRGPRTPDLVYYAAIGGVPHQLLQAVSGVDPECSAGTAQADCPQKSQLTSADWQAITGRDPAHYDFTGIDYHMLESENPRAGSTCPPGAADTCDPINGREWTTNMSDLEFACIFPLSTPRDCAQASNLGACDCAQGSNSQSTPLCQKVNGLYSTIQINGKAYPSIREMAIAHAMAEQPSGVQGIVSSLCPIHPTAVTPADPIFGYRPAAGAIVGRLTRGLGAQCLPPNLCLNAAGGEQCVVWVTLPVPGGEDQCTRDPGLSVPPANLLQPFQASQHQQWVAAGGAGTGLPDPTTLPICLLHQLIPQQDPAAFGLDDTCSASVDPGWCSAGGGSCPRQIVFSPNEPPRGATVNLQCFQ